MKWSLLQCVLGLLLLAGCERRAPRAAQEQENQLPRVVSFSPAISRTLVDFELEGAVVGRTPHCDSLPETIPVVGDLLNVNYEQLIRLQPTHLLIQPPQSGLDPHLAEMAKKNGWRLASWRLNDVSDIKQMVREIPAALYGDGSEQQAESARRAAELQNQIDAALSPGQRQVFRGPTLLVYSISPLSVFGRGTYLHDVLTALGGTNASSANHWATLSLEDVVRMNPQAIVLVRPRGRNFDVSTQLGSLWGLEIEAVLERRVAVLTHPDSFTPSTGVIGVAAELREILESFEAGSP